MLSLGSGSVCDVCLEPFGRNQKAPCSIQCGHVFCVDCLNHIARPTCPLCRVHFEARSVIKLHIDVDSARSSPSSASQAIPTGAAEQEARRLQEAIASVANEGTTEPRLRQLIAECKTFLSSQPRHLYTDFRASYKMIAYLCEIKSTLRTQNQAVETLKESNAQLDTEKASLERKIEYMIAMHKDETETSMAVEMSLREHCSRAHAAYETMVERYNFVVGEWMRLNEDVRRLRMPPSLQYPEQERSSMVGAHLLSEAHSTFPTNMSASLDPRHLRGAAVPDPDSFLISPLPEFTGALPSALDSFVALPDIDDDLEKKCKKFTDFNQQEGTCSASGHPNSCKCISFTVSTERTTSTPLPDQPRTPSYDDRIVMEDFVEPIPFPAPATHSGLALTAPKVAELSGHRSSRSHSTSSRPSSRSRHSSRAPTRPSSPSLKVSSSSNHGRQTSPSSSTAHLSLPQGRESETLRTRLHDLLQDSPISSSLPNLHSGHFPISITRETTTPRRSPQEVSQALLPVRTSSSTPQRPLPTQPSQQRHNSDSHLRALPSQPASININAPVSSVTPNLPTGRTVISSASAAAMALEKAQRERQRAERTDQSQESGRRRTEKERDRSERELARSDSRSQPTTVSSSSVTSSAHHRESASKSMGPSTASAGTLSRIGSVRSGSAYKDSNPTQSRYQGTGSKAALSQVIASSSSVAGLYA